MSAPVLTSEAWAAIRVEHPHWRSAHYLKLLHHIHWVRIARAARRRAEVLQLQTRIAQCAEGGLVLVVESGRDCDGCQYQGKTRLIRASLAAFRALEVSIAAWADGPYSLSVAKPSERDSISYSSTDLALEAFENGHQHVIYARSP